MGTYHAHLDLGDTLVTKRVDPWELLSRDIERSLEKIVAFASASLLPDAPTVSLAVAADKEIGLRQLAQAHEQHGGLLALLAGHAPTKIDVAQHHVSFVADLAQSRHHALHLLAHTHIAECSC